MLDYFQNLIANCAVEWRTIPGYEWYYEVSSAGHVRSVARMQTAKDGRKPRMSPSSLRKLSRLPNKLDYLTVMFEIAGRKPKRHTVHTLVAKAFLGEPPGSGYVVDHINGNCKDNRVSNLRYITQSNNIAKKKTFGNKFYGVHKDKDKWGVRIKKNGKSYWFGRYSTKEEALAVRLENERLMFGEFTPIRDHK